MPGAPQYLQTLIDRFDPEPFDAPNDRARVRLRVKSAGEYDVTIRGPEARLKPANQDAHPDATLTADKPTWTTIAADIRGGMTAYGQGRLEIRHNLHLGVGLLAATSGMTDPGRLEFHRAKPAKGPAISYLEAGTGPETVICIHGLGGTKGSFLPTVAALADEYRVIALDLPGFGDSDKPIAAPYDAAYFAKTTTTFMDELEIDRAHIVGNSMGGRVALELGFDYADRADRIALLAPSLAWLRERKFAGALRFVRPELGLLQVAPRPIVEAVVQRMIPGARDGWTAIGVDEFMRAYLQPRGRAAFYAAARNIYLEEPHGDNGFWTRLTALQPDTLFVWGKRDNVVPISFARHVEQALPSARHVEIDCGHVPQVERSDDTHRAIRQFLATRQRTGKRAATA
jgi:pimeloyl-ACP methyl ester carboxylesterase